MSRKSASTAQTTRQYSIDPADLGLPSSAGLPGSLVQNLQNAQTAGSNQYNDGSFRGRHPNLGAALDAALGVATLNPVNAVLFPALGQAKERRRKAGISEAYQEYLDSQLNQQKTIKDIVTPLNDARLEQQQIDQLNKERIARGQEAIPDLVQRDLAGLDGTPAKQYDVPYYSSDALKSYGNRAFGSSDINYLRNLQNEDTTGAYRLPSDMTTGTPKPLGLGGGAPAQSLGNGTGGTVLQTGTQMAQPAKPAFNEPMFVNDPQTIMQQLTSARNNALQEGNKRYEFDQQAPNRAAEVEKLLKEGKATEALALLRNAQTATEKEQPALIRAQAAYNNAGAGLRNRTPGGSAGRAPSALELMTPEQRQAYLNKTAGLQPDPLTPDAAIKTVQLQNLAAEKDLFGNPTPAARNAQTVLGQMASFGTPNAGKAAAPAVRPNAATLSTGRKYNP